MLARLSFRVYSSAMKSLTVREAEGQLADLIAEAYRGQTVVLTDGDRRVTLQPQAGLDLEEDSPELEAELLKAVNGPHAPLGENELREMAARARQEHDERRSK
jgi:antitoxin (DNA-binding transcriptional repressor) of toxin-antitoxin stability system